MGLKEKIKPESNVHSDGWTSYYTLGQHFNSWEIVNHSKYFKDPITGVNTNRIEGAWKHLKATMPGGSNRSKIEEYVQLYSFKEFCKDHLEYKQIGFLGLLSRANATLLFTDK